MFIVLFHFFLFYFLYTGSFPQDGGSIQFYWHGVSLHVCTHMCVTHNNCGEDDTSYITYSGWWHWLGLWWLKASPVNNWPHSHMMRTHTQSGGTHSDTLSFIICCRIACVCIGVTTATPCHWLILNCTLVLADFSVLAHENLILAASSNFSCNNWNKNRMPLLVILLMCEIPHWVLMLTLAFCLFTSLACSIVSSSAGVL